MDTIEFGSLYFEDGAWPVGSICGSGHFSIGDTELSKEIPWIAANGLLFSAQNICKNIGWKDLEMQNFIVPRAASSSRAISLNSCTPPLQNLLTAFTVDFRISTMKCNDVEV